MQFNRYNKENGPSGATNTGTTLTKSKEYLLMATSHFTAFALLGSTPEPEGAHG